LSHTAGVWIIWRTNRNREHADLGHTYFGLRRSGRGLGCGGYASENEGDDKGTDDMFHNGIPLKLYSQKKISLDKPDEVTIGYIMV
jgi:hypothetical protein